MKANAFLNRKKRHQNITKYATYYQKDILTPDNTYTKHTTLYNMAVFNTIMFIF